MLSKFIYIFAMLTLVEIKFMLRIYLAIL